MDRATSFPAEAATVSTEDYSCAISEDGSANSLSRNAFRCLLLILPLAILVVAYFKDSRESHLFIFAGFVLILIVAFMCFLRPLLRSRSRDEVLDNDYPSIDDHRSELEGHIMVVSHRLLPRNFHSCQMIHSEHMVSFAEAGRRGWRSATYHLAPHSPSRAPPSPGSDCGFLISRHSVTPSPQARRDAPPSYEEALSYPAPPISSDNSTQIILTAETPPPAYDRAIV